MAAFAGTVAASNASRVLRFGNTRGVEVNDAGLRETTRIPAAQMFDIWSRLVRTLDSPDLPIVFARDSRLEDLELLGFVALTAPTSKQGLETFVRYSPLLNDGRRWEISSNTKRIELRLIDASPRVLGVRLSHETSLAQLVGGARQLCGERIDPLLVSFRHPAPPDVRSHRALFRCELEFDAPFDRVVFVRDAFDEAPAAANRALWTYLRTQADAALRVLAPRPLVERVNDEVANAVSSGVVPDMASVAQSLGTTERSLRRALATAGVSFRKVVDEARRERARQLLDESESSITRIAFDTGFSDTSAFSHACRRWFGRSPSELVSFGSRDQSRTATTGAWSEGIEPEDFPFLR